MSKRDYYEVLDIKKGATDSEIKKGYRTQSKKYHPDVNPDGEEQFKDIAEAYETLSDKGKREQYDAYGHNGPSPQGGGRGFNMEDLFNQFDFGGQGQRQRQRRGQNLIINIKISLEEAFNGVTKKFRYKRTANCKTCNGVGGKNVKSCNACHGHGHLFHETQTPMGRMRQMVNCNVCNATGNIVEDLCVTCNGIGLINEEESVEAKIPSGIREGDSLQYIGIGHAIKGGPAGNLLIKIFINNHNDFIINGNDLKHQINLSYPQLVLGDKVQIPTIEGKKIKITIPPYSKPGDTLRIVSKGMSLKDSTLRGDMMVILEIEIPTKLSDEEKELIEKLKNIN